MTNHEAYDMGYDAYWEGVDESDNPFDADKEADARLSRGWGLQLCSAFVTRKKRAADFVWRTTLYQRLLPSHGWLCVDQILAKLVSTDVYPAVCWRDHWCVSRRLLAEPLPFNAPSPMSSLRQHSHSSLHHHYTPFPTLVNQRNKGFCSRASSYVQLENIGVCCD